MDCKGPSEVLSEGREALNNMPVTLRKPHLPGDLRIEPAISRIHPLSRRRTPLAVALLSVLILTGLGVAARFVRERFSDPQPPAAPVSTNASSVSHVARGNLGGPMSDQLSDPGLVLESGRKFARHKDWAQAERAYRILLQTHPLNREAVVGLSDILYAQHRYEDSAAVLNQLSMGNR
jgi:hypothetical protein